MFVKTSATYFSSTVFALNVVLFSLKSKETYTLFYNFLDLGWIIHITPVLLNQSSETYTLFYNFLGWGWIININPCPSQQKQG